MGNSSLKKRGTEKYWIKERLKYKIEKSTFDLSLDGNVCLLVEIRNNDCKCWYDDIRIKGKEGTLSSGIDQPIAKKIKSKGSSKVMINLKMGLDVLAKNLGEVLVFEFVGSDEKKNTKFCSDSFEVVIEGKIFGQL